MSLQVNFLPEYKIHPLLQGALDNALQPIAPITLAVSFPLLHTSGQGKEQYDPGQAAVTDWPAQLLQSGIAASLTRLNQHHVKVQSSHSLQACHHPQHLPVRLLEVLNT